jgi:hypothetical protein
MAHQRLLCLAAPGVLALLLCCPPVMAGDTDVAIEWVNDFGNVSGCSDLDHRDEAAEKFYDYFTSHGWDGEFSFGDQWAWEEDFKEAGEGGTDHHYVDICDIVYVATHGTPDSIIFDSTADDQELRSGEAHWGDDCDLEWLIVDACSVLHKGDHPDWHSGFAGLHIMCSFDSSGEDKPRGGKRFARKCFKGYSIVQAWNYACEVSQPSWADCATMGVYSPHSTRSDHIWGEGSVADDSPSPNSFWYHSHSCD